MEWKERNFTRRGMRWLKQRLELRRTHAKRHFVFWIQTTTSLRVMEISPSTVQLQGIQENSPVWQSIMRDWRILLCIIESFKQKHSAGNLKLVLSEVKREWPSMLLIFEVYNSAYALKSHRIRNLSSFLNAELFILTVLFGLK